MSATTRLTPARLKLLAAAVAHKHGNLVGGDPRVREALISAGYFEVYARDHGPLFRVTAAGRAAHAAVVSGSGGPTDARLCCAECGGGLDGSDFSYGLICPACGIRVAGPFANAHDVPDYRPTSSAATLTDGDLMVTAQAREQSCARPG